jgi:hypothetical protein
MAIPNIFGPLTGPISTTLLDQNFAYVLNPANLTFTPPGIGAVPTTVAAFLSAFHQYPTNQIFSDLGADINRINDRLFVGGATVGSGDSTHSVKDWVDTFYSTVGESQSYVPVSVFNSFTTPNAYSLMGGFFAAQTSNIPANTTSIGLMSLGLHNNTTLTGQGAWAIYTEAHKLAGVSGYVIAQEFEVRNMGPSIIADPYTANEGVGGNQGTTNLLLGAGCGLPAYVGNSVTVAIALAPNPSKFNTGINFNTGCLDPANNYTAIAFATNHRLRWYSAASTPSANIYSTVATGANGQNLVFTDNELQVQGIAGASWLLVGGNTAAANYIATYAQVTGSAPVVGVGGTDAQIDLALASGGTVGTTSTVKFSSAGMFSANGAVATSLTGIGPTGSHTTVQTWLTIKDNTGTVRYIPCF